MKPLFLTLLFLVGLATFSNVSAVTSTGYPVITAPMMEMQSQMTVNDFLAFDAKTYRTIEGKKIGWLKRTAIEVTQKNFERKIRKGKLDGAVSLSEAAGGGNSNIHGLLSVIFAVAGLFIPYLGLAMIIAGLVLGIIGIKKDANPTLAIIGTVLSGAFLLLLIIAIAILASGGWWN